MNAKLKPLGWFVRCVVTGSVFLNNRRTLAEIELGDEEERDLVHTLKHHRETRLEELSVEERLMWGALFVFACARRMFRPTLFSAAEASAVETATKYWTQRKVSGADEVVNDIRVDKTKYDAYGAREWQLEVERMLPILRHHRVRVRVVPADGSIAPAEDSVLPVALRAAASNAVRVVCAAAPGAKVTDSAVLVPVGDNWTEIVFELIGTEAGEQIDRIALEGYIDGLAESAVEVEGVFAVRERGKHRPKVR